MFLYFRGKVQGTHTHTSIELSILKSFEPNNVQKLFEGKNFESENVRDDNANAGYSVANRTVFSYLLNDNNSLRSKSFFLN